MFINTQAFREAATHFEKYGRYDDGEFGSREWEEYWDRENDRVENGYTTGGRSITGRHYTYLNYGRIMLNKVKDDDAGYIKKKRRADREEHFPDFWDEDYVLFWTWDIAEFGISMEKMMYVDAHLNIPIWKTEENLSGGKNHLWLKPRGTGASWKGSMIPIYRQFFGRNNNTFLVAHEDKYLTDDGLFDKYKFQRNFLMQHATGFARSFNKMDNKEMHYRAARTETTVLGDKVEKGRRASVYGLSVNGDPSKVRGKRGTFVYEEFGSFPAVHKTWEVAQSSVEQDGIVYGTQFGFGTGGDTGDGIESLDLMFRDTDTYNLLAFKDIWSDMYNGEKCAYFTPATKSLSFKDSNGNTDEKAAYTYLLEQREIKRNAADSKALEAYCAEKPLNPEEALSSGGTNIFPTELLMKREVYLKNSKEHLHVVSYGDFENTPQGLKFKVDKEGGRSYEKYPVKPSDSAKSKIALLHTPYKIGGIVPDNLYRISVDAYRFDDTTGDSIGSIFVIENPNKYTPYKGDRIVAWYSGRPNVEDDFSKIVFQLAEYYNAKVAIENDEPGDIIGYAKRNKRVMKYLEEEFQLAFDDNVALKKGGRRKFGIMMASGKNDLRVAYGNGYINEWLLRERYINPETGEIKRNLDFIYSLGLISELIKYKKKGNFDRVASLRVNMYHERELEYNLRKPKDRSTVHPFFRKKLYDKA
jgi:hypothetical protein